MRLLLLFIAVPLVELYLLLKLAEWTSGTFTFALVILTGVVGATLARRQGWSVVSRLQRELDAGEMPAQTLVDALMIFVAGALLITPGVLTDGLGFSLLVPACRRLYRRAMLRWLREHVTVVSSNRSATGSVFHDDRTIDAEVVSRRESGREGP